MMLVSSIGHLRTDLKNSNRSDVAKSKYRTFSHAGFGQVNSLKQSNVKFPINFIDNIKNIFSAENKLAQRSLDMIA